MRNNQLKIVSLYETVLGSKGTVATVYASQREHDGQYVLSNSKHQLIYLPIWINK